MRVIEVTSDATPEQVDLFDIVEEVEKLSPPSLKRLRGDYLWIPPGSPRLCLEPDPLLPPVLRESRQDVLDKRLEVVSGIVIHAALERLACHPLPDDAQGYVQDHRSLWTLMAAGHDLAEADVAEVANRTCEQIERVLNDTDGRWLLDQREDGQAELSITGVHNGRLESIILDRTFIHEGRRWVIDYKTASAHTIEQKADPRAFIRSEVSRYRPQLSKYAALAESLFNDKPTVAIYFTAITHLEVLY
jgi:ATP-dependent exoDNAse (exonuclease V) beta subunit